MKHPCHALARRAKQRGATLIVGLILLLVLTVLGVSGMNTSRMEVRMAGNTQFRQDAFQLAESGIDIAIASGGYDTTGASSTVTCPTGNAGYECEAATTFQSAAPLNSVAFSMGNTAGGGSVLAYHFDVDSKSKAPRNATASHRQSFYVLGPGSQGNQP